MAEAEEERSSLLPDGAEDFLSREFGIDAPAWRLRLAPLFQETAVTTPHRRVYHQARQELDAIEPALTAAKKAVTALKKWPHDEPEILRFSHSYEEVSQALSVAVELLDAAKTQRELIRRSFAPYANRDRGAIAFAQLVAQIFVRHDEPVTFGQDQYGEPTTRFGRVVKFGLEVNEYNSHWRRPTEVGSRAAKEGFPEDPFRELTPNTKRQ